jgi:hypothetical protein
MLHQPAHYECGGPFHQRMHVGFPSSPSRLHRRRPHGSSRRTAMVLMELEILGMNFGCVLAALADAKIPEKDCILPLASKLLGYAIVAASTTVKLPQVPPLSLSPASRRALFVSNVRFCLDLWRALPVGSAGGSQFHVLCVSMACAELAAFFGVWCVLGVTRQRRIGIEEGAAGILCSFVRWLRIGLILSGAWVYSVRVNYCSSFLPKGFTARKLFPSLNPRPQI